MTQYRKAKKWKGKDLALHVGNGDKRILDGDVLTGDHWERFVGLGFLERVPEGQAPAKAETPVAPSAPVPVPVPPPAREGGMTRSGAGKAAAATGKSKGGKGKSEDKLPSTEETDKAFAEKAAELAAGNIDPATHADSAGTTDEPSGE